VAAKLLGLASASFFQLLYASAGVSLAFLWINRILGKRSLLPFFVFMFFGGLDVVGNVMLNGAFVDGLQDSLIELPEGYLNQYLGDRDAFFFKYLAKNDAPE
jgi:hypothetical protein